jgi:hypothetical protein
MDFAQLDRPAWQQYIAAHKYGKGYFCIALKKALNRPLEAAVVLDLV